MFTTDEIRGMHAEMEGTTESPHAGQIPPMVPPTGSGPRRDTLYTLYARAFGTLYRVYMGVWHS